MCVSYWTQVDTLWKNANLSACGIRKKALVWLCKHDSIQGDASPRHSYTTGNAVISRNPSTNVQRSVSSAATDEFTGHLDRHGHTSLSP